MPTSVNLAKQCLTAESAYALEEAVNVARRRGHSQTTSLHAVSALLSLPTSLLRDACARVRNSAYSPRLQFKALDLCLSVSLDRIQSGQPGSDDPPPPISNSLMAAIKRSQAHQRRLPDNFRVYQEMSQNPNSISCVKVEIRQLILSILDDPIVSRVFGESGFRSSELKLSIIRPVPHLLRYSSPRGGQGLHQHQPLFLCDLTGNQKEPVRWGFTIPNRNLAGDYDRERISEVLNKEKGRNPLLVGVSAYGALTGFINSLENRTGGILPVNIASEISDQITGKFDKPYIDSRFRDLGKLAEQVSGSGLVLNFGDLKVFSDGEGNDLAASYVVNRVTDLLRRSGRRVSLIGATASHEVYEKTVRKFPHLEKDWDLELLNIGSFRSNHKSSLMGSFVPFGGFFSSPSDLKLPFSGFNNQITEPVSSISDHTQSTLPPWLQMTTRTNLNQKHGSKTKEGLESVCGNKSTSSASASTDSAKSVTTDLNLRVCPVTKGLDLKKNVDNKDSAYQQSVSYSGFDQPKDINAESFKIIYRRLTDRVSGQEEAARVISYALSQPPNSSTRRDVWLNLIGSDTVGKRRMSLVLAEIVYQSEHRFMAVDLGSADHGIGSGCDDAMRLRGKTMVDHIFEVMCRNPFCVVFLENIEKADEKLQTSLSKAIETGKFMDSHGREVGIGNTMFVMTSYSEESPGTTSYSEDRLLRVKGRQVEIRIETMSKFTNMRLVSSPSSTNKRKLVGLVASKEINESAKIGKRLNRTTNKVLDLNLPAQETETEETEQCKENSNNWLANLKNQDRLVEVSFKPFDFELLAERIKKSVKEVFDKLSRPDCSLEMDTKIMERLLAAVYFSDNREDTIKDLMEKVVARVFFKVKEKYEITSSCVVKLVGQDLESSCNDLMEMFLVKS
ncbi:unnamed protein product [Cochlearia groenlandica]